MSQLLLAVALRREAGQVKATAEMTLLGVRRGNMQG